LKIDAGGSLNPTSETVKEKTQYNSRWYRYLNMQLPIWLDASDLILKEIT
jgi:hypothetical protein